MVDISVSPQAARRFILAKQGLLDTAGAGGVRAWRRELTGREGALAAIHRLRAVQIDPMTIVAPNHDLALRARVKNYNGSFLNDFFSAGETFEYWANARCILPIAEFPNFYPKMIRARENIRERRQELLPVMEDVLKALREQGPSRSRDLGNDGPRLSGVGWNPATRESKASVRALDYLLQEGRIVVCRRDGNEKYYCLTEDHLPAEVSAELPAAGDGQNLNGRGGQNRKGMQTWSRKLILAYLDAFALATRDHRFGWQKIKAQERRDILSQLQAEGHVASVTVDSIKDPYFALAKDLPFLTEAEGWEPYPTVHILPPLDNLLWSRPRLEDLWGFEYRWEVYMPAKTRRFGPYTMPILEGDTFIGRVDLKSDRSGGALLVNILHFEEGVDITSQRIEGIAVALEDLALYLGLKKITLGRVHPERAATALIGRL